MHVYVRPLWNIGNNCIAVYRLTSVFIRITFCRCFSHVILWCYFFFTLYHLPDGKTDFFITLHLINHDFRYMHIPWFYDFYCMYIYYILYYAHRLSILVTTVYRLFMCQLRLPYTTEHISKTDWCRIAQEYYLYSSETV